MSTVTSSESLLINKPRIYGPIIKICFEIYHAIRPFHHKQDEHYPSIKRSVVFLFFVALRWYFFLKRLINDKSALNSPLSMREKLALFIAILGHLLMIWSQNATLKHEEEIENMNAIQIEDDDDDEEEEEERENNMINTLGPYSIIRHPHHLGKWVSEAFVAIYQDNKVSMAISILTLGFTINRANKEEAEYNTNYNENYQRYKRKVPNKLIPGIY